MRRAVTQNQEADSGRHSEATVGQNSDLAAKLSGTPLEDVGGRGVDRTVPGLGPELIEPRVAARSPIPPFTGARVPGARSTA